MSEEMVMVRKTDLEFVRAYNTGLEGMKVLLTRERDEARACIVELEKELSVTNDTYTDERELRGMYQARCAELEAHAATLTGLANQYKADRDSLEETCRMHSARVIELEKQRDETQGRFRRSSERVDELQKQRDELLSRPSAVETLQTLRSKIEGMGIQRAEESLRVDVLDAFDVAIASITDTTKPTKPLAYVNAPELIQALDLTLPSARCFACNEGPEAHRITVSVKWCNHSEVIAEYFPKDAQ